MEDYKNMDIIAKRIKEERKEFEKFLKPYLKKKKTQAAVASVNDQLANVYKLVEEQNWKNLSTRELSDRRSAMLSRITELDNRIYGEDSVYDDVKDEAKLSILSEALYLLRRSQNIIYDEIEHRMYAKTNKESIAYDENFDEF